MQQSGKLNPSEITPLNDLVTVQDGGTVSRTLMKNGGGTVTVFAFDAGQQLSEHSAPFDALVYVLEGALEIHLQGQPNQVTSGNVLLMPANVPHAVTAHEKAKMLLVMLREAGGS